MTINLRIWECVGIVVCVFVYLCVFLSVCMTIQANGMLTQKLSKRRHVINKHHAEAIEYVSDRAEAEADKKG